MTRFTNTLFAIAAVALLAGCKKDKEETPQPVTGARGIEINLTFMVDQVALQYDDIQFFNAAGNNYGVTRLQFYLSKFVFETTGGTVYTYDEVKYIDARSGVNTKFSFENLPFDTYKKMTFFVGLDPQHNLTDSLPNTVYNSNMAWPIPMGGGYHFLKLEGNFKDQGNTYGFGMHIGLNLNLVTINLVKDFSTSESDNKIYLEMNVNEWFVNPFIFDFNTDGNYTMGDTTAMGKISANGVDVFTLK